MSYDHKKRFVLDFLADRQWHHGMEIVDGSRGKLIKSTAYATFERMEGEQLLTSKDGDSRGMLITAAERWYRKT